MNTVLDKGFQRCLSSHLNEKICFLSFMELSYGDAGEQASLNLVQLG